MQNVEFWSTAIQFKNWVFQTESWALLKTLLSVRHVFPADCCTIVLFSLPVNLMQTLLKQEIQNLVRLCFLKLHELFLDLTMYHFGSLNISLLKFLPFFCKICSVSVENGFVPKSWKHAFISLVPKYAPIITVWDPCHCYFFVMLRCWKAYR